MTDSYLVKVRAYCDDLPNVVICCELHGADIHLYEVTKKILRRYEKADIKASLRFEMTYTCEFLHIFWPGRAEHQGLSIWPNLTDNFTNLRFKAHVKHSVGLIHDEIRDSAKIGFPTLKHIDQPSRCCYDFIHIHELEELS